MDLFEGYVGIRLWDGQQVNDAIFTLLLSLLVIFAIIFRFNFQHFIRMMKDAIYLKERQNLFDETVGKNVFFFRDFMTFQALFLCSIALYLIVGVSGMSVFQRGTGLGIAGIVGVLFLFYQFKQLCYFLLGFVFAEPDKYRLWKRSYNALMGVWGVLLYIPVVWLMVAGQGVIAPAILFVFSYLFCRFAILYKTIRIFHRNNIGLLYISLYLCTLEITPLMLLCKGVLMYNF